MIEAHADEDRYNHVVYVDLPLPPDFHIRERRRPSDPPPPIRRRSPVPTPRRCELCGSAFVARNRAAGFKRAHGKVYRRRFCSRACYRRSFAARHDEKADHGKK